MQDLLKGTHHEFMSTKMASASKLKKGKAVKCSVTGLSKSSPKATAPKKPKTSPPTYNEVMRECNGSTKQPLHVPVVPVLRSPPPVSCVTNVTPPTDIANGPNTLTEPSANVTGVPVVSAAAVVQACSSLVKTVLSSWAGTPKLPSRPGSALLVRHDSLPTTHPPSHAATPLVPNTSMKIEDKYAHPCPQRQASASHNTVTSQNKETQAPTMVMELTSRPSRITGSTQIGNITVDQFATSMGHSMDHIIEALEETFSNTEAKEDSEATVVEPQ